MGPTCNCLITSLLTQISMITQAIRLIATGEESVVILANCYTAAPFISKVLHTPIAIVS